MAKTFNRAVAAHNWARALREAAVRALAGQEDLEQATQAKHLAQLRDFSAELRRVGAELTPGWWGEVPLTGDASRLPALGGQPPTGGQMLLRIGSAHPTRKASFPVVLPLLGSGHLVMDADIREPRVAALLRGVLLRLVASVPAERLKLRLVDAASAGIMFAPFRPLVDAGVVPTPAIDVAGFTAILAEAEDHLRTRAGSGEFLVVLGALPPDARGLQSRLAALAHAGPASGLHLVFAGWPPAEQFAQYRLPALANSITVTLTTQWAKVHDPPGQAVFSADGRAFPAVVALDPDPDPDLATWVCQQLAAQHEQATALRFGDLLPDQLWTVSSAGGLETRIGRHGRQWQVVRFDDATPHGLLGGRTGSGKTNTALALLGGLTARYAPDELAIYLLDFKEGVSFTEFTPTGPDPTWVPHARAVGVESDREYGLAVLAELVAEMTRRADSMKRAGVTKLGDLRRAVPETPFPRVLAVIDEFQVLFAGNDTLAGQATGLLEEIARKGRGYGIHLLLASQTMSGIDALVTKTEAVFGQFPLRIALAGGSGVLAQLNTAADVLPVGTAVVNTQAGVDDANTLLRIPHADPASVAGLRHRLWDRRPRGNQPPAMFVGYAEQHLADDPTLTRLHREVERPVALVGRCVDVGLSSATVGFEPVPGRHLAVLGTSPVGADILHAAAVSLARQHQPGAVRFILAPLAGEPRGAADDARQTLTRAGHTVDTPALTALPDLLTELTGLDSPAEPSGQGDVTDGLAFGFTEPVHADRISLDADFDNELAALLDDATTTGNRPTPPTPSTALAAEPPPPPLPRPVTAAAGPPRFQATYLLLFAADQITSRDLQSRLRYLLQHGPDSGIHVIGWWRTTSSFTQAIGHDGRDHVAALLALNIPQHDIASLTGDYTITWQPRPNRGLLIDRHDNTRQLIVPYLRPNQPKGGP